MNINKVLFFSTTILACMPNFCIDALDTEVLISRFNSKADSGKSYFRSKEGSVFARSANDEKDKDVKELFSGVFQLAEQSYFDDNGFQRYLEYKGEQFNGYVDDSASYHADINAIFSEFSGDGQYSLTNILKLADAEACTNLKNALEAYIRSDSLSAYRDKKGSITIVPLKEKFDNAKNLIDAVSKCQADIDENAIVQQGRIKTLVEAMLSQFEIGGDYSFKTLASVQNSDECEEILERIDADFNAIKQFHEQIKSQYPNLLADLTKRVEKAKSLVLIIKHKLDNESNVENDDIFGDPIYSFSEDINEIFSQFSGDGKYSLTNILKLANSKSCKVLQSELQSYRGSSDLISCKDENDNITIMPLKEKFDNAKKLIDGLNYLLPGNGDTNTQKDKIDILIEAMRSQFKIGGDYSFGNLVSAKDSEERNKILERINADFKVIKQFHNKIYKQSSNVNRIGGNKFESLQDELQQFLAKKNTSNEREHESESVDSKKFIDLKNIVDSVEAVIQALNQDEIEDAEKNGSIEGYINGIFAQFEEGSTYSAASIDKLNSIEELNRLKSILNNEQKSISEFMSSQFSAIDISELTQKFTETSKLIERGQIDLLMRQFVNFIGESVNRAFKINSMKSIEELNRVKRILEEEKEGITEYIKSNVNSVYSERLTKKFENQVDAINQRIRTLSTKQFALDDDQWRTLFFLYMLSKINELDYSFFEKSQDDKANPQLKIFFENMYGNIEQYYKQNIDETFKVKLPKLQSVNGICHDVYSLLSAKGLDLRNKDIIEQLKGESVKTDKEEYSIDSIKKVCKEVSERNIFNKLQELFDKAQQNIDGLDALGKFDLSAQSAQLTYSVNINQNNTLSFTYSKSKQNRRGRNYNCAVDMKVTGKDGKSLIQYDASNNTVSLPGVQNLGLLQESSQFNGALVSVPDTSDGIVMDLSKIGGASVIHHTSTGSELRVINENISSSGVAKRENKANDYLLLILRLNIEQTLTAYKDALKAVLEYVNKISPKVADTESNPLSDKFKSMLFPAENIRQAIQDTIEEIDSSLLRAEEALKKVENSDTISDALEECKGIINNVRDKIIACRNSVLDSVAFSVGNDFSILRFLDGAGTNVSKLAEYKRSTDLLAKAILDSYSQWQSTGQNKHLPKDINPDNKINRINVLFANPYSIIFGSDKVKHLMKDISLHDFLVFTLIDIYPDFKAVVDQKMKENSSGGKLFYLPIDPTAVISKSDSNSSTLKYLNDHLRRVSINTGFSNVENLGENVPLFLCYETNSNRFYLMQRNTKKKSLYRGEDKIKEFNSCIYDKVNTVHYFNDYINKKDNDSGKENFNFFVNNINRVDAKFGNTLVSMLALMLSGKYNEYNLQGTSYSLAEGGCLFSDDGGMLQMKHSNMCGISVLSTAYTTFKSQSVKSDEGMREKSKGDSVDENIGANAIILGAKDIEQYINTSQVRILKTQKSNSNAYRSLEDKLHSRYKSDFTIIMAKISNALNNAISADEIEENQFEVFIAKLVSFASVLKYIALSDKNEDYENGDSRNSVKSQADFVSNKITEFLEYILNTYDCKISYSELRNVIDVLSTGGIALDSRASSPQGLCITADTVVAIYKALVYRIHTAHISPGVELSESCDKGVLDKFPFAMGSFLDVVNMFQRYLENEQTFKDRKYADQVNAFGRGFSDIVWMYTDQYKQYNGTQYNKKDSEYVDLMQQISNKCEDSEYWGLKYHSSGNFMKETASLLVKCGFANAVDAENKDAIYKTLKNVKDELQNSLLEMIQVVGSLSANYNDGYLRKVCDSVIKYDDNTKIGILKFLKTERISSGYFAKLMAYEWYKSDVLKAIKSFEGIQQSLSMFDHPVHYNVVSYSRFVDQVLDSILSVCSFCYEDGGMFSRTEERLAKAHALATVCYNNGGFEKLQNIENSGAELFQLCYKYKILACWYDMLVTGDMIRNPNNSVDVAEVLHTAEYLYGIGEYIKKGKKSQAYLDKYLSNTDWLGNQALQKITTDHIQVENLSSKIQAEITNMGNVCLKYVAMDQESFKDNVKREMGMSSLLNCNKKCDLILQKIYNFVNAKLVSDYLLSKSVSEAVLNMLKSKTSLSGDAVQKVRLSANTHAFDSAKDELNQSIQNMYMGLLTGLNEFNGFRTSKISDVCSAYIGLYNTEKKRIESELATKTIYKDNIVSVDIDQITCDYSVQDVKKVSGVENLYYKFQNGKLVILDNRKLFTYDVSQNDDTITHGETDYKIVKLSDGSQYLFKPYDCENSEKSLSEFKKLKMKFTDKSGGSEHVNCKIEKDAKLYSVPGLEGKLLTLPKLDKLVLVDSNTNNMVACWDSLNSGQLFSYNNMQIKKDVDHNGVTNFKLLKIITDLSDNKWECEYLYNNVWKCTKYNVNYFFDSNSNYLGCIYIDQNDTAIVTDSSNYVICSFNIQNGYITPLSGSLAEFVWFKFYNNNGRNVLEFYQPESPSSAGLTFDRIKVNDDLVLFENDALLKAYKILGTDLYGWYDEISDVVRVLNEDGTQVLSDLSRVSVYSSEVIYYDVSFDDKNGTISLDFKTNGAPTFVFVSDNKSIGISCKMSEVYELASQGFIKVIGSEDKCYTLLTDKFTGKNSIALFDKVGYDWMATLRINADELGLYARQAVLWNDVSNVYLHVDSDRNVYANRKNEQHNGDKLLLNLDNGSIIIENSSKDSKKDNPFTYVEINKDTFTEAINSKGIKFAIDNFDDKSVESNDDVQKLAETAIFKSQLLDDIVAIQKAGNENLDFWKKVNELDLEVFNMLEEKDQKPLIAKINEAYKNAFDIFVSNDIMQAKAFDKTLEEVRNTLRNADLNDSWNWWNDYLDVAKSAMDKFKQPLAGFSKTISSTDVDKLDVSRLKPAIEMQYFQYAPSYAKTRIHDSVYRSIIKNKLDFIKMSPYASFWYTSKESNKKKK